MSVTLAAVAPAAPAAFDLVVALGALIAFVVCWGLLHSWKATFGRFLHWLAGVGIHYNHGVFHLNVSPFGFAATVSTDVEKWLSQGLAASERAMVRFFSAFYAWATWIVTAPFRLGEATYTALHNLAHRVTHTVPRTIRETVVKPITKTIVRTAHTTVVRVGNLDRAIARAKAEIARYAHTVQHSIAVTLPRLRDLEHGAIRTRELPKWLRRHLTAILAGGVLTAALARLGLGWLRCRNVSKAGKQVCGMNTDLLNSLLGEALLIVSAFSLVEMARALEEPTELIADNLGKVIREL